MAGLRFIDLRSHHPMEFLDFTSLTPGEFPQLVLRLCRKFLVVYLLCAADHAIGPRIR